MHVNLRRLTLSKVIRPRFLDELNGFGSAVYSCLVCRYIYVHAGMSYCWTLHDEAVSSSTEQHLHQHIEAVMKCVCVLTRWQLAARCESVKHQ